MRKSYRKKYAVPAVNPLEAVLKAMIEKQMDEERPYGSTRIGFGATIKSRTVRPTEA